MAIYTADLNKEIALIRVFKFYTVETGTVPQPSVAGILMNAIPDSSNFYWTSDFRQVSFENSAGSSVNIPAFFGQVLSASVSEEEKQSFSIDVTFPYGQPKTGVNLYEKELSVLYPKNHTVSEVTYVDKDGVEQVLEVTPQSVFTLSSFNPSYLYRIDIVDQNDSDIIDVLNGYYAETSTLADVDKQINSSSKEHYWAYLSDYAIDKGNKDSTITFSFIDIGYKLSTSWNDLKIPESTFMSWANNQLSCVDYLYDAAVKAEITRGSEINFFDGWSISGYLIAILYYAGMFPPYSLTDTVTPLTLARSSDGTTATYTLTRDSKVITLLKIPVSVESINIPISLYYPETDPLVSNGFFNEVPPFQYMSDTLNQLADLIGFFWVFDRNNTLTELQSDCLLRITSETYNIPADTYDLTSDNIYTASYEFDDSNLRNNISVFGRPYGLDLQYGATIRVDESVDLFGYRNFVFESPLVLSTESAENIAKNIASTYCFKIGSVVIDMPYTESIQLHQPIMLSIDSKYDTGTDVLYVNDRTINFERFRKSSMSLDLTPKIERTIVDFGAPLTNLSSVVDGVNGIGIEFEDVEAPSGYTLLNDSNFSLTNLAFRRGFGYFEYNQWDFDGLYVYLFTKRVTAGDNITFKYQYTDKRGTLKEGVHNSSDEGAYTGFTGSKIFNIKVVVQWNTYTDTPIISVFWEFIRGMWIYTGPRSVSSKLNVELGSGISTWFELDDDTGAGGYYVPYDLNDSNKFYARFHLTGDATYGLVEGGFLVIPVSPVYRSDSTDIPFNGMTYSSGVLAATGFLHDSYSLDAVIRDLNYYSEGFDVNDSGELVTYGAVANVAGIDVSANESSITSSIKTNTYLYNGDDDIHFEVKFTPFMDGDLGKLAYSNVMLVVPYIKSTQTGGKIKLLPQSPIFVLHAKIPEAAADKTKFDYDTGLTYLEYSDNEQITHYSVSYLEGNNVPIPEWGNTDTMYPLSNFSTMCNTTFKYTSDFPFILRLGINHGPHTLLSKQMKNSDITTGMFVYYSKWAAAASTSTDINIYPFSDLEGVVKWLSDNPGNESSNTLIGFIDPFVMFPLSEIIDNPNRTNNMDRMKLTPYLIASSTSTSARTDAIATFINAANTRYTTNASNPTDRKIADFLVIDYNRSHFEG